MTSKRYTYIVKNDFNMYHSGLENKQKYDKKKIDVSHSKFRVDTIILFDLFLFVFGLDGVFSDTHYEFSLCCVVNEYMYDTEIYPKHFLLLNFWLRFIWFYYFAQI